MTTPSQTLTSQSAPPSVLTPQRTRIIAEELLTEVGVRLDGALFREACLAEHSEQIVTGGVRAGKSTEGASAILRDVGKHLVRGTYTSLLYWIIGPDYAQTREEFRYLQEWFKVFATGLEEVVFERTSIPHEGPRALVMRMLNAQRQTVTVQVDTKSAGHIERLGTVAPNGILVVEAGQCAGTREDGIRRICLERAAEKGAWVKYTGTLENDEQKPIWAWYSELAEEWKDNPTASHAAYSLPSWENVAIYGSCKEQIENDPALAQFCPDDAHGTGHSGWLHPSIVRARTELPPDVFDRRFAGKPTGLQSVVYPQLRYREQLEQPLLRAMPQDLRWVDATGGIDYGTVHPTALVVITWTPLEGPIAQNAPKDIGWVREVWFNDGEQAGNTEYLNLNRSRLERKYRVRIWGVDPNERFLARSDPTTGIRHLQSADALNVSGSQRSRDYRIGLTGTRLDSCLLLFDKNGPGVPELYEEQKRVHYYKNQLGQLVLRREKDDRTAAEENAVEVKDGTRRLVPPQPGRITISNSARRRSRAVRRVA